MAKTKSRPRAKKYTEEYSATEVKEDSKAHDKPHGDMIAEAAYFKAQKRHFAPGHEIQDWLEAEDEINQRFFSQ